MSRRVAWMNFTGPLLPEGTSPQMAMGSRAFAGADGEAGLVLVMTLTELLSWGVRLGLAAAVGLLLAFLL